MTLAIIAAVAIGLSTVLGAVLGFFFKKIPHRFNDAVLGFSAGIMLAASIIGLILPSVELGGSRPILITCIGVICGALFLSFADRFTPHLHSLTGSVQNESRIDTVQLDKIMLFIFAIAIHNLPEGIAAGVGFSAEDTSHAITMAIGIAVQNVPEGLVVVSSLLMAGVSRRRAFLIACFTALIEFAGALIGYFAASISAAVLPFLLAFAGGTMLYIISNEIIPETHSHGYERLATYSLLLGFLLFIVMDYYI